MLSENELPKDVGSDVTAAKISVDSEQDAEILRLRVAELQEQVQELEHELDRERTVRPKAFDWGSKIRPMIYLGMILFFGAIPSWLVFMNRWLFVGDLRSLLDSWWCRVDFLCTSGLPHYFATILVCIAAVFLLVLLGSNDPFQIKDTRFLRLARETPEIEVSKRRQFLSRLAFGGASILAICFFLYGLARQQILGLGFLAAIVLYWLGWLARGFPARKAAEFLGRYWRSLLSLCVVHVALILLLRGIERQDPSVWLSVLAFGAGLIYLMPYLRALPSRTFWLINIALLLFTPQTNSWAYSVVGDEYAFFDAAEAVVQNMRMAEILSNLFKGLWVYGKFPFLSTVIQASSMKLFGVESFGWRFSNIYLSALSVGLFYIFFRHFLQQRVAILAALFLAFSSFLMAFSKIGYNNLQALFAMSLALACSAWAIAAKRSIVYALAGLCLGLSFYVYPAALYVIPLPLFLFALYDPPRNRQSIIRWAWFFISLAMLLLPLFLQPDYWLTKSLGLLINNPDLVRSAGSAGQHMAKNLFLAFLSPLYSMEESHFVVVGYMDLFSALLLWVGLAAALKWARRERFIVFLLLSYLFLLVLVGATHDRIFPPATRMFMLLPWFSMFAAIGLDWLVEQARGIWGFQSAHSPTLLFGLMSLVLCLNLLQAYPLSRKRSFPQELEMMFLRMVQETQHFEPLMIYPKTFLFITDTNWGIDGLLLQAKVYTFPAYRVRIERLIVNSPGLPKAFYERIAERNTLLIFQESLNPDWRIAIEQELQALGKQPCPIREYTNRDIRFVLWHSPDMAAYCISGP